MVTHISKWNNCLKHYISSKNTLSLVNCATVSNGDNEFCNCKTCSENEGDCDYHYHCQDGRFCGSNNCPASLGFHSEVDCCSTTQVIESPGYPFSYPSNAYETWLLTAPPGSITTIQFQTFHVRHIKINYIYIINVITQWVSVIHNITINCDRIFITDCFVKRFLNSLWWIKWWINSNCKTEWISWRYF